MSEKEPLYAPAPGEDSDSSTCAADLEFDGALRRYNSRTSVRSRLGAAVNWFVLGTNLLILVSLWVWKQKQDCLFDEYGPNLVSTPAKHAITYETKKWNHESIYNPDGSINPRRDAKMFGPPSQDTESEWDKLTAHQDIVVQLDEMPDEWRSMDNLVQVGDGPGYYASISAYHGMHCVRRLYQYVHKDHFYHNLRAREDHVVMEHAEHCLNILLQTIQCNPDLTLFPMQWFDGDARPVGLDEGTHQCRSWSALDGFMASRNFNAFAPGMLTHPELGPSFPEGKGDILGIAIVDHAGHAGHH